MGNELDWLGGIHKASGTRELAQMVRGRLCRGERRIVLDLGRVSRIDAAGIGELVRAYNIATAGSGALRIVNTNPWVREMLERVGLFDRLDAGSKGMGDVEPAKHPRACCQPAEA
jgi:anti-anti-sigma factor